MNVDNLKSLLGDHRRHQSHFQIDRLVIARAGITTYGRYVQCLRELYGRYRSIRECVFRLEELNIDIDELGHKIGEDLLGLRKSDWSLPEDRPEHSRRLIALKRKRVDLVEEESRMRGVCYEFARYYVNAEKLKEVLGPLTPQAMEDYESELMMAQVRVSIAADCMDGRSLKKDTWHLICSLPPDLRKVALSWQKDGTACVEYFLNLDDPYPGLEPSHEQQAMLRKSILGLIAENPELDYGAHTYRSDGLSAQGHDSLRSHVLQNHTG